MLVSCVVSVVTRYSAYHFAFGFLSICICLIFGAASGDKGRISREKNWLNKPHSFQEFFTDRSKAVSLLQFYFVRRCFPYGALVLSMFVPYLSFFVPREGGTS